MRRLTAALTILATAGTAASASAARAPVHTVDPFPALSPAADAIALPGQSYSLRPEPDSSLRVAVGGQSAVVTSVGAADLAIEPSMTLLAASKSLLFADPRTTPDGGVVVASAEGALKSHVSVVRQFDAGGQLVGSPQTITGFGHETFPLVSRIGPTGAVIILEDTLARGGVPHMVFRPAGQPTFGPATAVGPSVSSKNALFDLSPATYQVALGPDGGGLLLVSPRGFPRPSPYLRRISPAGGLGARIALGLGKHQIEDVRLAIGPLGTGVVVSYTLDPRHPNRYGESKSDLERVSIASLPAGTDRPTPPRLLGSDVTDAGDGGASGVDLTTGANDQTLVLWWHDIEGTQIFEGPASNVQQLAPLTAGFVADVHGTLSQNGDATITGAASAAGTTALVETHQPAGGTFGALHAVEPLPNRDDQYSLGAPVALADGRLAMSYSTGTGGKQRWAIARFTP